MPLLAEMKPPLMTVQTMSVCVALTTTISISPSSMRMCVPRETSLGRPAKLIDTISDVPCTSRVVSVKLCPAFSSTFGSANLPMRISGPFVSASSATGSPSSLRMRLTASTRTFCSSCVWCEKLTRATSIPESIRARSTFSSSVAGPSVQMIFVFLIFSFCSLSVWGRWRGPSENSPNLPIIYILYF